MSQPFLGQIEIFAFGFAPKGWAQCNGQLLPINQNQALFSLLGTTYGGDGRTTFGLPNLQGRNPVHVGTGFALGALGGEANHTLIIGEIPTHTHTPEGSSAAVAGGPAGNLWAPHSSEDYGTTRNTTMNRGTLANTGGSQPHLNLSPYLVLNFVIAMQGIFP